VVFAPESLDISRNNVLVQTVNPDRGVLELQPRKISDLTPTDTLHLTQTIDPANSKLPQYSSPSRTALCQRKWDSDRGHNIHWYDD